MEETKKNDNQSPESQIKETVEMAKNNPDTTSKKETEPAASQKPATYAQKFGTYGAIAGILIMIWALPSAGSVGESAMMGAICGAGGAILGTIIGALIDKVSKGGQKD